MRSSLPLCRRRDGRGGGIEGLIACGILDAIASEDVREERVVFRTMRQVGDSFVALGQATQPCQGDERGNRFGISLKGTRAYRSYESFHRRHAAQTAPLADLHVLAENLLYDRPQIAGLLWPAFRIAGLPRLEAAVQRGATVTYLVHPLFTALALIRSGACAWPDGLMPSCMIGLRAG